MNQAVMIAVGVLAAMIVLRVANLPPFQPDSARPTGIQRNTTQTLPTPQTRSTGFSSNVSVQAPAVDPTPLPSGSPGDTSTSPQKPVPGQW